MSDYQAATAQTIEDAVAWATGATRSYLETYVRLVDAAAERTVTADSFAQDLTSLATSGLRDMARAASIWAAFGQAMVSVDVVNPNAPNPPGGGTP